jgi:hypothetical protein
MVAPPEPEPPPHDGPLDLAGAPRVPLGASPLHPEAPKPIRVAEGKARRLREVGRAPDKTPLARAESRHAPYDPRRVNEVRATPAELPTGARTDIPVAYDALPLRVIRESGGKLLLVYGPRYLAVVDGKKVEQVLDLDPPELPLTKEDRTFSDVHQAVFEDGVVYVCRGYNGWLRSRKGYVTAVDAATGELRWRSPAQTCGGSVALVGDYVVTGYGEDVLPYALKLLKRSDGTVVQSIRNDGAALDFLVDGTSVVVETYKHRITYRLE